MLNRRVSLLLLSLAFSTSPALALARRPLMPPPPGPPGRLGPIRPPAALHPTVPMLLPLAEMRSYKLHLSDHQASQLAIWQNRHMRIAIPLMKRLRADRSALRHGLLEGAGQGVLRALMHRLNQDRARMLRLKVAQVRVVHKTLSLDQWRQLLMMYRHMPMRRFRMMRP